MAKPKSPLNTRVEPTPKSEAPPKGVSTGGKLDPHIKSECAADYIRKNQHRETPPANGLFDKATKQANEDLQEMLLKFKRVLKDPKAPGVKVRIPFLPFLLIRQRVGDHGIRPISTHPLEMPDIWICKGDPLATPAIPAGPGFEGGGVPGDGVSSLSTKYTVYAHVWNLGRAPIAGVKVEFFWFEFNNTTHDPTNPVIPSRITKLGTARVDLQGRDSLGCHTLVKCPHALVHHIPSGSQMMESYTFSILVHVSSLGDPVATPFHPATDRHVGRRDFSFWVIDGSGHSSSS